MERVCKKCSKSFRINDKQYYRKLCYECCSYKTRNERQRTAKYKASRKECSRCKTTKDRNQFYIMSNRPHPYCKTCYNLYVVEQTNVNKRRALDYKGNKCSQCGYNKYSGALVFHHLDPKKKEFAIVKLKHKAWSVIKEELDKCVLLCANCHVQRHALYVPKANTHFSGGKRVRCCTCHQDKNQKQFYKRDRRCKDCRTQYSIRNRQKIKQQLLDLLGGCCKGCGISQLEVLSFHHIDPSQKRFEISSHLERNKAILLQEVQKCDILCCNCHAELHKTT
jgi:hypothetical protein